MKGYTKKQAKIDAAIFLVVRQYLSRSEALAWRRIYRTPIAEYEKIAVQLAA